MNHSSDVVIVGGGVIGCSVALALSKNGLSVTLVDKSLPGKATSASAGGLWAIGESIGLGCGIILHASESQSGEVDSNGAPQPLPRYFMHFLIESNQRFRALGPELKDLSGIDIEAESGAGLLYPFYTDQQAEQARQTIGWIGDLDGMVEELSPEQADKCEPLLTRDLRGAVYFPGDNQVNPMLLTEALKRSACKFGARFLPETTVRKIETVDGAIVEVETTRGKIPCAAVVNAAGAWSARIARMVGIELPIFPVRGQILCTEALENTLRNNLSTIHCYLLQKAHGEVIIGSTTERCAYDVGVRFDDLRQLSAGALRAVPVLRTARIKRSWAGLRPGTPDELPILGPVPELRNYFNATGGFRTGIVAAPLTAEIVAANVLGRKPPLPVEPFLLTRFRAPCTGKKEQGAPTTSSAGRAIRS